MRGKYASLPFERFFERLFERLSRNPGWLHVLGFGDSLNSALRQRYLK